MIDLSFLYVAPKLFYCKPKLITFQHNDLLKQVKIADVFCEIVTFFFLFIHIHMYSLNNYKNTYKKEVKSIKSGTHKNNL